MIILRREVSLPIGSPGVAGPAVMPCVEIQLMGWVDFFLLKINK